MAAADDLAMARKALPTLQSLPSTPTTPTLRRAEEIPEIPTPIFSRPQSRLLRAETTYSVPQLEALRRAQTVPLGRPRACEF